MRPAKATLFPNYRGAQVARVAAVFRSRAPAAEIQEADIFEEFAKLVDFDSGRVRLLTQLGRPDYGFLRLFHPATIAGSDSLGMGSSAAEAIGLHLEARRR